MRRSRSVPLTVALVLALALPAAAAPATVSQNYDLAAQVELDVKALECTNTGSTLEFSGTIAMGGLTVEVNFKNNVKGTHSRTETTTAGLEVVPAGGDFSVPKQPVHGGVGGNPWISVIFAGKDGKPDGQPILLGRCVQGITLKHISKKVLVPATAKALLEALECSNKGSRIKLSANRLSESVNAWLLLDNNKNKVVHQWEEAAKVGFSLYPPLDIPKQGALNGAGGNPIITVKFLGHDGEVIGNEYNLGRCVKLG